MSASMSHKIQAQSSPLRMHEETKLVHKQGIVSILGSESERTRTTPTSLRLRRTISADMSSKKWLSQNRFTPMKRIASSEDLSPCKTISPSFISSSDEEEEGRKEAGSERGQSDIWSSIQRDKNKDQQQQQPGCFDIWSCILSNKSNEESNKSVLPPYVHPLVKRSQSSLSEKSLEICTESLGSETGSDVLSSYPQSETEEDEHEQEQKGTAEANEAEKEKEDEDEEEFQAPKYSYTNSASSAKKSSPRSFPPPLPSLSRRHGPSLQMRSRRDEGRLVLEAVSLPSQNNFCAQRQDGRLVLTFANQQHSKEEEEEDAVQAMEEASEEEDGNEEDETEEEQDSQCANVMEQGRIVPSAITSSLALMMNKPIELVNSNRKPNWSEKLNQVVDVNVVNRPRVARLISSGPAMASAAASFNVYEYCWRTKPSGTTKGSSLTLQPSYNSCSLNLNDNSSCSSKLIMTASMNPQPQVVVLRGKNGDYLLHNFKTCKESRRSFLFWEPYCIATS